MQAPLAVWRPWLEQALTGAVALPCVQEDLELESGEYFLAQQEKAKRKKAAEQAQQAERVAEKKRKRQEAFVPPQVLTLPANKMNSTQQCHMSKESSKACSTDCGLCNTWLYCCFA